MRRQIYFTALILPLFVACSDSNTGGNTPPPPPPGPLPAQYVSFSGIGAGESERQLWTVGLDGTELQSLAGVLSGGQLLDLYQKPSYEVSPSGDFLVALSGDLNDQYVDVVDVSQGTSFPITQLGTLGQAPTVHWSPDGKQVLISRVIYTEEIAHLGGGGTTAAAVLLVDPYTESILDLSMSEVFMVPMSWQPDSSHFVLATQGAGTYGVELDLYRSNGTLKTTLNPFETEFDGEHVVWEGDAAAFILEDDNSFLGYRNLYQYDSGSNTTVRLTPENVELEEDFSPTYSPSGNWLACMGETYLDKDNDVYFSSVLLVPLNPSGPAIVLGEQEAGWEVEWMAWSPTEDRMAYMREFYDSSSSEDIRELVIADTAGNLTQIPIPIPLDDEPDPELLSWSPDGQWIAFLEDEDEKLYLYDVAAGGAPVAVSVMGYAEQDFEFYTWSPDSKWMFIESSGLALEVSALGSGNRVCALEVGVTTTAIVLGEGVGLEERLMPKNDSTGVIWCQAESSTSTVRIVSSDVATPGSLSILTAGDGTTAFGAITGFDLEVVPESDEDEEQGPM